VARASHTDSGGPDGVFHTTAWTDVLRAGTDNPDRAREALETLLARYWKPVYCYLRRKGYENDEAKDLTQGFFHTVVLERGLLTKADPARGRFRAFLLTALDRYCADAHRMQTAKKRRPEGALLDLDAVGPLPGPAPETSPEQAFHAAWAAVLIDQALASVKQGLEETGRRTHWELFRARVVHPTLGGIEPPPLAELCARFGVPDELKASNMITTAKRRFRSALRRHVGELTESPREAAAELAGLRILLGGRA
jgi:RNA polymerase sigma-70 factor (ECF subfamily)